MKDWMTAGPGIVAALGIAMLIAWAGSQHGVAAGGWPVFVLCGVFAFLVQWVVFVHAWLTHSERFFDLTGSLTYIVMVVSAVVLSGTSDFRGLLLAGLIVVWAARLGPFLYNRIKNAGEDRRFRSMRHSFPMFLMTWTLQGTWVFITACCALAAITTTRPVAPDVWLLLGTGLWLLGFALEVVADRQKSAFRANPDNAHRYIDSGLWAWSRHPNYFGEMVLWLGIAVIAWPVLQGWQYATLISPVFVYVLLRYISGVRMLDHRAKKLWGEEPEYQEYRRRTPMLIPKRPTTC